jgi:hypothetical protein
MNQPTQPCQRPYLAAEDASVDEATVMDNDLRQQAFEPGAVMRREL